jgi:hypothetical protein
LIIGLVAPNTFAQHIYQFTAENPREDIMFTEIRLSANGKTIEIFGNWLGASAPTHAYIYKQNGGNWDQLDVVTPANLGGKNFNATFVWPDPNAVWPQQTYKILVPST